jgi:hypothetical protein
MEKYNTMNDAHAINGTENSHYDLARYAEAKGFEVVGDPDDMEKSFIARPGDECFGDRIIGEINGDAEAKVTITANLS